MTSAAVDPLGLTLEEIIELNKQQSKNDAEGGASAKSRNDNWRQRRSRSRNRNEMRNRGRSRSRARSASRGRSRSRARSASRGRSRSRGRSVSRGRNTSRGRNQYVNGRGNSTRGRPSFNANRGRNSSRNRNASENNQYRSRSRSRGNQNRNRSTSRGRNWVREQSSSPQGNTRRRSSSRNRQNNSQGASYFANNNPLWKRNDKSSYKVYKTGQYFMTKFARSRVQLAKRRLGGMSFIGRNKRNQSNRTGLRTAPALNNTFRSDYILSRKLNQRWNQGLLQPTFNNNGAYEGLTVQIVNDKAANNTQKRMGFRAQNKLMRSTSQQSLVQRIGNRSPAQHVVEVSPGGSVITTVRQQNGGNSFQPRVRRAVSRGCESYASPENFESKLNPRFQQAIAEIQSRGSGNRAHLMDSEDNTITTPTAVGTGVLLSDRFSGL